MVEGSKDSVLSLRLDEDDDFQDDDDDDDDKENRDILEKKSVQVLSFVIWFYLYCYAYP